MLEESHRVVQDDSMEYRTHPGAIKVKQVALIGSNRYPLMSGQIFSVK